ncbi:MAG: hypothetical protein RLZZ31_1256 [Actinomycetota bacterium]|jgi:putative oxidoreductase
MSTGIDLGINALLASADAGKDMWNVDGLNLGLLIIRVVVGVTLATHGLNKIFGGGKIAGTAGWFGSMGMKMPKVNAWMAALTEIGAGLLLAIGLLTPLAAAGMIAIMVVAFITTHWKNGWFIFNPGGGVEYVVVLAAVGFGLACTGAGEWSVDNGIELDWAGITGLVIAAVAGVGGALLQLAAFWRPPKSAA